MRMPNPVPLAAILCAIAAAGALAMVARGATGSPAPFAQPIQDSPIPASPVTSTATAPATNSTGNTGFGLCNTPAGAQCNVEYIMSKGTSVATSVGFGPGGLVTGNPITQPCNSETCIKSATATPSPGVTVNYWEVTGSNISVICAGPPAVCG